MSSSGHGFLPLHLTVSALVIQPFSPLSHRSSSFGVFWGLSFLQVFLPHTEGSDGLLIRAEAHEVDISTSAPSKGLRHRQRPADVFISSSAPLGLFWELQHPLVCVSARRAPCYLPEMTNFPVKLDVTGRLSESPQTTERRLLLLPKLAEGSYLKSWASGCALLSHTHLLIPGGETDPVGLPTQTESKIIIILLVASQRKSPRSRHVCSSGA